jgi:hypothetical protein
VPGALVQLDRDLWVAPRPLKMRGFGDIGCRMTVLRLEGGLFLHSPVPLDDPTRRALDAQGPVRWVVGPSRVHHFYLGDYASAYPEAELCAAPGLPEKRRDLAFDCVLDDSQQEKWKDELRYQRAEGAPRMGELVFFHPATRTVAFTDLVFNVPADERNARLFHWLAGSRGRFGPHRMVRSMIRDRAAAARSFDAILEWDFDRVIVTHGEVLETGGRQAVANAFAYLRNG